MNQSPEERKKQWALLLEHFPAVAKMMVEQAKLEGGLRFEWVEVTCE